MPAPASLFSFVGAPPRNLPFPTEANITAVELLTFLPNSVTSVDVINRLALNGALPPAFVNIIQHHREVNQPWRAETCNRILRNTMRNAGYDEWRLATHRSHASPEASTWDESSLSVKGYRTDCQISGVGSRDPAIPFVLLTKGVRHMPSGNDALDLTRMVKYCVEHEEERWLYPKHYKELLERIGGPCRVGPEASDGAAIRRYAPTKLLQSQVVPRYDAEPRAQVFSPPNQRSGRPRQPTQKRLEDLRDFDVSDCEQQSDDEEKTPTNVLLGSQEYIRRATVWVRPPLKGQTDGTAITVWRRQQSLSAPSINHLSHGPPTLRSLHLIESPKSHDISGWAENLRWATEQYETFGETGWTECSEHMDKIASIRQEQSWASSELLLKISDDLRRDQEEEDQDEAWLAAMGAPKMAMLAALRDERAAEDNLPTRREATETSDTLADYRKSWAQSYR